MSRSTFFELARKVSLPVAVKIAFTNGIARAVVDLWAVQYQFNH